MHYRRLPGGADEFLACLKVQPAYRRALENLALCYEALQDFAKAFDCYRKAIALEDAKKGLKNAGPVHLRTPASQPAQTDEGLAALSAVPSAASVSTS